MILVMTFQMGEILLTWSAEKYAAVFSPFSDNIGGRSFQERLCLPVPIDVVYTWVNGSDPALLKELKEFRLQLKHDLNLSMTTDRCNFVHCVPAFGMTVDPPFPQDITLRHFGILYPVFRDATDMFTVEDIVRNVNLTVVMFESADIVKTALKQNIVVAGQTAGLQQLYYSSDSSLHNSKVADNTLIMSGLPYGEDESRLMNKVTEKYESKNIISFTLHSEKGVAVIKVLNQEVFKMILADKNMTVNGKSITFSMAQYVWDLRDYSHNDDISASRFEDNEELRYSLRSVEKYAPWVRHIFVVTNGQLPSWLNMDNPRLTVVTHQELFVNKSHLPTFSSPAIESHIHRIKGLSDKFIYLNDDVMFGKEVWPDDFYTEAGGQKIYLTWPVPNCQEGCPASWIKDGYCDRSCNNSECEWDGGDCVGSTALQPLYGGGQAHGGLWSTLGTYCNSGCANNWIADKYCDVACNVQQCAFDAGDCGIDRFNLLYQVDLHADKFHYSAVGHNPIYFNYSSLVTDLESVDEGFYEEDAIIRSVSIAQKFQVVTLVLHSNHSATVFNFSLHVKDSNLQPLILNFTVLLDTTFEEKLVAVIKNETKAKIQHSKSVAKNDSFELPFVFTPKDGRLNPFPRYRNISFPKDNFPFNWSSVSLPTDVRNKFQMVEKQYSDGDLTETGYNRQIFELLEMYRNESWSVEIRLQKFSVSTAKSSAVAKPRKRNDMFVQHLDIRKKKLGNKNKSETHYENEKLHFKNPMKMVGNRQKTENEVVLDKLSESKSNKTTGRLSRALLSASDDDNDDDDGDGNDKNEIYRPLELSSKAVESYGFLPWEKLGIFNDFQKAFDNKRRQEDYVTSSRNKRRLLDTFANSLRHVSRIYNKAYGYTSRKVPAHIAHMIDKNIMLEMQAKFPDDWAETSSHRMRSSDDMQYAFAYFYYLMSETRNLTVDEVFHELDADHSGILSDREIRTMATRLYELPLELQNLVELEERFINCSKNELLPASISTDETRTEKFRKEVYYDKRMPQVTLGLITGCNPIQNLIKTYMKSRAKYRYSVVGDEEVVFKMIRHNVSLVVAHLDEIRKTPKKFVCINDNIDYSQESAKLVKAVLRDFYESVLPVPSKFELSKEYRNKFLHIDELRQWWRYRELVRWILYTFLLILMFFAVSTFICDARGLSWARRRLFRR